MTRFPPGTTALITGASSGIGWATAQRLAAAGVTVALAARRLDRIEALAMAISDGGGQAAAMPADLTSRSESFRIVNETVALHGRLDIVVNAAGVMLNGASPQARISDWERMVDLNLKALMYVTKAAMPHLVRTASSGERGVTDVVNISSIAGRQTKSEVAIYSATKFGVTAATEAWRQEFAPKNVRFCVIAPGIVDTELLVHQNEAMQQHYHALFESVEKLRPEDIAESIAHVVSAPRRVAVNEIVIRPTDQI